MLQRAVPQSTSLQPGSHWQLSGVAQYPFLHSGLQSTLEQLFNP